MHLAIALCSTILVASPGGMTDAAIAKVFDDLIPAARERKVLYVSAEMQLWMLVFHSDVGGHSAIGQLHGNGFQAKCAD